MEAPNYPYVLLLTIAGLTSAAVTLLIWRRARPPLARPSLLMSGALTWWSLTYAIHWSGIPRPWIFFWLDATYVGVVIVPTALLVFALRYVGQAHWLSRRTLLLLAVEPSLTLLILWTDNWHALFFAGMRTPTAGAILAGGSWFWVNAIYSYALVLIATLMLLQAFWRAQRPYKRQLGALLLGASMPWVSNILSLANITPLFNLDLTPLAFTLTSLTFAYSLLRFGFLDIVPVARDVLVDVMADGVLVIDSKKRVVDINAAARRLLRMTNEAPIGLSADKALATWPSLASICNDASESEREIVIEGDCPRFLHVRTAALRGQDMRVEGRLCVLSDITDRKEADAAIQRAHELVKQQLLEIKKLHEKLSDEAIRDPLTGLLNRRYFEATLPREIERAEREQRPLSLALLDIDFFKQINDTQGHKAGDLMLQAIASILTTHTRTGDAVCRYGGEEFIIILPGASPAAAQQRMNELCVRISALSVPYQRATMSTTISIGLAGFPQHGRTEDALLHAADEALYRAKNGGRNRVVALD